MRTIAKIGSALKRAALYVPCRIARAYRGKPMGLLPPITRSIQHIESKQVGPFASTVVKLSWPTHDQKFYFGEPITDLPKKPRSDKELLNRARKAIRNNWAMYASTLRVARDYGLFAESDQKFFSGEKIEDEAIGPFRSTTLKDAEQVDLSADDFLKNLPQGVMRRLSARAAFKARQLLNRIRF